MKRLLLLLLLLFYMSLAVQDSLSFFMGKQFVTSFLEVASVGSYSTRFDLIVHGLSCCTLVNISVQGTSFYQNVTLQQGEAVSVTLPSTAMLSGSDISTSGVVLVSANNNICVITQVWATDGYDYAYVYPVDLLGPRYYVITPNSVLPGNSQFAILSLNRETSVTVTLQGGSVTFKGLSFSSGSSVSFKLPAYQGAQVQLFGGDLTGTFIQADSPIVVISGHQIFQYYFGYHYGYVYDQLLPVSSWDKSFLLPPPSVSYRKNDNIYVIASESTMVKVSNTSAEVASASLGRGEVYTQPISTSALRIDCDHDVMVLMVGSGNANSEGTSLKPFMSIVMPTTMFQTSQLVHAPAGLSTFLVVLTVSGQTQGMIMDGFSFPSNATWDDTMSGSWQYTWVQVAVSTGSHYIQQLRSDEVWALSYSFSGNISVASTMTGNTRDSFNFFGTRAICSCNDSAQSSQSPITRSSTPKVTVTFTSQTSMSCRGDISGIYVMMTPLNWWEALRYCRRYYTDLLSIPDRNTQDLVATAAANITRESSGLWIGLRRHRIWGLLYWTDGQPTDYVNWGKHRPADPLNKMCTALEPDKNFTWYDHCCDRKLNFICY